MIPLSNIPRNDTEVIAHACKYVAHLPLTQGNPHVLNRHDNECINAAMPVCYQWFCNANLGYAACHLSGSFPQNLY